MLTERDLSPGTISARSGMRPLEEVCDNCGADLGVPCVGLPAHMFCGIRLRAAAETRECREEERIERQREVLADVRVTTGGGL